jgi:hypothetical protein
MLERIRPTFPLGIRRPKMKEVLTKLAYRAPSLLASRF